MKRNIIYLAALLPLAACSNDEVTDISDNEANAINYRIVTDNVSRASVHFPTSANISSFKISAVKQVVENNPSSYTKFFIDDVINVTYNENSSSYTCSYPNGKRYFPSSSNLLFFALHDDCNPGPTATDTYSPAYTKTYGVVDNTDTKNTFKDKYALKLGGYKTPSEATKHEDLLYASVSRGKSSTEVTINFRHALSQINFIVQNISGSHLYLELADIKLSGVKTTGDMYFGEGKSTYKPYTDETATYSFSSQCYWNNLSSPAAISWEEYDDEIDAPWLDILYPGSHIEYDGTSEEFEDKDLPMLVIPQSLASVSIQLHCRLYNIVEKDSQVAAIVQNNLVYNDVPTEFKTVHSKVVPTYAVPILSADSDEWCDLYIPLSSTGSWTAGKKYTYTIKLGADGNSNITPKDEDGNDVMVRLSLNVTTDDWGLGASGEINEEISE